MPAQGMSPGVRPTHRVIAFTCGRKHGTQLVLAAFLQVVLISRASNRISERYARELVEVLRKFVGIRVPAAVDLHAQLIEVLRAFLIGSQRSLGTRRPNPDEPKYHHRGYDRGAQDCHPEISSPLGANLRFV